MNLNTFELMKTIGPEAGLTAVTEEQGKALQKTVEGIASDIIDYCRKNSIWVCLCGGSALGAVRHQGFIPWDDDMDLFMTREGHDAFVKGFLLEHGDRYWIHTPGCSDGYTSLMTKVVLKGTVVRQYEDRNNPECGASVDIFVVENTYDQPFLRKLHGYGCLLYAGMLSCRRYAEEYGYLKSILPAGSELLKAVHLRALLGRLLMWRSLRKWAIRTDKWFARCRNGKSVMVAVPSGRKHFFGEMCERSELIAPKTLPFEGHDWPVPGNPDHYLIRLYGDYMQIPPPEKREKHMVLELKL